MVPLGTFFPHLIKDIYGREKELREITNSIKKKEPLIIITGPTGVGKTTLLRSVLEKYSTHSIEIQLLQYSSNKNLRRSYVVEEIERSLQILLKKSEISLKKYLSSLKGVMFDKDELVLDEQLNQLDLAELFLTLDRWSKNEKTQLILAVDDAEILSRFQHLDFEKIFAFIYDNCKNITIILVGQEKQILRKTFKFDDIKAPLYGRAFHHIHLARLTKKESERVFYRVLSQHNKKFSDRELEVASKGIAMLPGIISTIIIMALELLEAKKINNESLTKALETTATVVGAQFADFLLNRSARKKYEQIMIALANKPLTWKKLKDSLELKFGEKLYDKNFNDLIGSLEENDFIEKQNVFYNISNPLLAYYYSGKYPESRLISGTTSN